MFRAYLLKLLFYLVDPAHGAGDSDKIDEWLADNWGHPGFRAYVAERDAKIVRQLAGGDQLVAAEHRKVWQMTGQRTEMLLLGQRAKTAFLIRQKRKGR